MPILAWLCALGLVVYALYLAYQTYQRGAFSPALALGKDSVVVEVQPSQPAPEESPEQVQATIPDFSEALASGSVSRRTSLHTSFPNRPSQEIQDYTVDKGDSVFEIARKFKIKPETVLWANYDQLNDNPDTIALGMQLKIPPVNGVLYQWAEGDTVEAIAARFEANPMDILTWSANQIDLVDQKLPAGSLVMIPNGHREYRQWVIPTIPRGNAGVSKSIYGAGACEGSLDGAFGSGSFIWPAGNHSLSGNDYWDGHLGIDIAAGEGASVYAADAGVVVYAGWANGGYGYMVMIDHGNGYQTLYAHLSSVVANCGQSVGKGATIGLAGSTGNSTGAHLHFEVRYLGGFVNPWSALP